MGQGRGRSAVGEDLPTEGPRRARGVPRGDPQRVGPRVGGKGMGKGWSGVRGTCERRGWVTGQGGKGKGAGTGGRRTMNFLQHVNEGSSLGHRSSLAHSDSACLRCDSVLLQLPEAMQTAR